MMITLTRADQSGVFALPDGVTSADIEQVLIDGVETYYVAVKGNTEIDVPAARLDSVITVILK